MRREWGSVSSSRNGADRGIRVYAKASAVGVGHSDQLDVDAPVDWSRYVSDEEDAGQTCEQGETNRLLLEVARKLACERGWNVHVGSNQFFQWNEDHLSVQISPDVYILDDSPPPPLPSKWQTWKPGVQAP